MCSTIDTEKPKNSLFYKHYEGYSEDELDKDNKGYSYSRRLYYEYW